jgi:glycosyltransferase involved in cell wall biosynthesis
LKISIVIPTYNSEKYLERAINSVVSQSYQDYELIVIDGGSKDNTLKIIQTYKGMLNNKVKWVSEPDKGEPDAINKGMRMASGDIIAYLDSDDVYEPGCFEKVNNYFQSHDVKWLYGKCRIIDENDNETRSLVTKFKEVFQPHYSYNTLLMFDYIAQPSAFWRREVLESVGYTNIQEKLAFDYEYWLRIGAQYKAGYINQYLSCWRSHHTSETAKALSADLRQGLDLSVKYSPSQMWLRPFQYGVYCLSLAGYKVLGAL